MRADLRRSAGLTCGSLWLLILATPTAWLAATLGALARLVTSRLRWAIAIVVLVEMASIVTSIAAAYFGPSVFGFDHFFGYFPGPIYYATIPVSSALLSFRAASVLWGAAAVAAAGALATGDRSARHMHAWWAGCVAAMLIADSAGWGADVGWRTTDRSLRAALRGEITVDRLVLHFPRDLSDRQVEELLRDATFNAAQLERVFGVTPTHPIHIMDVRRRPRETAADRRFWRRVRQAIPARDPHQSRRVSERIVATRTGARDGRRVLQAARG